MTAAKKGKKCSLKMRPKEGREPGVLGGESLIGVMQGGAGNRTLGADLPFAEARHKSSIIIISHFRHPLTELILLHELGHLIHPEGNEVLWARTWPTPETQTWIVRSEAIAWKWAISTFKTYRRRWGADEKAIVQKTFGTYVNNLREMKGFPRLDL